MIENINAHIVRNNLNPRQVRDCLRAHGDCVDHLSTIWLSWFYLALWADEGLEKAPSNFDPEKPIVDYGLFCWQDFQRLTVKTRIKDFCFWIPDHEKKLCAGLDDIELGKLSEPVRELLARG